MPQRIDLPLLRRRADHNDGIVSTLREVTLHQFDIERIENLDVYCRRLRILFLQNNVISKIENLHKLKDLEYLNLAVNNIRRIENLERCESLAKLDLTLNFIEDLLGVEKLRANELLRELYLVGNPCAKLEGYRSFVIGALPQLKILDGQEITDKERLEAVGRFEELRDRILEKMSAENLMSFSLPVTINGTEENGAKNPATERQTKDHNGLELKRNRFTKAITPHTPESRLETARDLADLKAASAPDPDSLVTGPNGLASLDPPKRELNLHLMKENGEPYQRNDGRWEFHFVEREKTVGLEVDIGKELHLDQIRVDVHKTWIRMTVLPAKREVVSAGFAGADMSALEADVAEPPTGIPGAQYLQVLLPCGVKVTEVLSERSKASGKLLIFMKRACDGTGRQISEPDSDQMTQKASETIQPDLLMQQKSSEETLKELVQKEDAKSRQDQAVIEAQQRMLREQENKARQERMKLKGRNAVHLYRMQMDDGRESEWADYFGKESDTTSRAGRRSSEINFWESTAPMSMLLLDPK